jgi:hypothetical protein
MENDVGTPSGSIRGLFRLGRPRAATDAPRHEYTAWRVPPAPRA